MSAHAIVTDAMIDYACRVVWNGAPGVESRAKPKCAQPGQPYRNRDVRCEHGFARGLPHIACPECEPERWASLSDSRPSKRVTKRGEATAATLERLSSGPLSTSEFAEIEGIPRNIAYARLKITREAFLTMLIDGRHHLTKRGAAKLAELRCNGLRGEATHRASTGHQTTLATHSIGAGGEVSR